MDAYDVGDGWIRIYDTNECRYYVEFENWLAFTNVMGLEHETLNILMVRGRGEEPDTVMIFDSMTGMSYEMTVPDGETGFTCIPWPLVS